MKPKKKYSFFAHFNRINMQRGLRAVWTVHFRGKCIQAQELVFDVPCKSRYIPDGKQPRATLRGQAHRVYLDGASAIIQ